MWVQMSVQGSTEDALLNAQRLAMARGREGGGRLGDSGDADDLCGGGCLWC